MTTHLPATTTQLPARAGRHAHRAATRRQDPLTGLGAVLRLALRRDRVMLAAWLAVFTSVVATSAFTVDALYTDPAMLATTAAAVDASPPLLAMYGPITDPGSVAALGLWKVGPLGVAIVGLCTLLVAIRHTRAEEESGRLELLLGAPVGRAATATAALIVSGGFAVVVGVAAAVTAAAAGFPASGSWTFGAGWAGAGLVFAAVGVLAAQLCRSARAARGLAAGVLGAAYALRAAGDATGHGWPVWLSPVGWSEQMVPFADDRWWPLLVSVTAAVLVGAAALRIQAGRDLGAGLVAERAGPASGGPSTVTGLSLRMQRGALLGWAAGFALLGGLTGGLAAQVAPLLDQPQMRAAVTAMGGTSSLTDAFLAAELGLAGLLAAAYAVSTVTRLSEEEQAGRTELLLAGPVARSRWIGGTTLASALTTAVLMAVAGAASGLVRGTQTGDLGGELLRLTLAALVQVPAAWVVGAAVLALYGLSPRLAPVGWLLFAAVAFLGELGPLLRLERWVLDLSPFTHLPRLPGGEPTLAPLLWLVLVAVVLVLVGGAAFRRRDLA